MSVITDLFGAIANIITGLISAITSALSGLIEVFYDDTGFTVLGALLLIGLGMFFVMFAFRFIMKLIKG